MCGCWYFCIGHAIFHTVGAHFWLWWSKYNRTMGQVHLQACHLSLTIYHSTNAYYSPVSKGRLLGHTVTALYLTLLVTKGSTVKPVKLTTFIRWPPSYVGHISVEPMKSYIVCIYDHLRNFSTFICWIPVYVSHAKWNRGSVYTSLYWPW